MSAPNTSPIRWTTSEVGASRPAVRPRAAHRSMTSLTAFGLLDIGSKALQTDRACSATSAQTATSSSSRSRSRSATTRRRRSTRTTRFRRCSSTGSRSRAPRSSPQPGSGTSTTASEAGTSCCLSGPARARRPDDGLYVSGAGGLRSAQGRPPDQLRVEAAAGNAGGFFARPKVAIS